MVTEAEATSMAQIDSEAIDETSRSTRCCFVFPCFNSRRQSSDAGSAWWQRAQSHDRWWTPAVTAFQKVREWSEIVAGPKWKTFIRRFNRNRGGNGYGHDLGKFQYDPLSYSLNFEEDSNFDNDDECTGFRRDFSSRYASSRLAVTAEAVVEAQEAR